MALYGKLEIDVETKAQAEKFYEVILKKPYYMSHTCLDKVQSCELLEGKWGEAGSIISFNYVHDGNACVTKRLIEAADEENKSLTWKELEGELIEHFKSFRHTIQCNPKDKGSVIHIILDYEKLNEEIPDPHSYLKLCADVAEDIGAHLGDNNEG